MRTVCRAAFVVIVATLPARAVTYVDLELVLAVDISLSMDFEEQKLQRDGYVAALRDPQVIKAISTGPQGRIALTYVEWAGNGIQRVVVPWQIIGSADEANRFADKLAAQQISRARRTSISSAIAFSATLFGTNKLQGLRRVIDVSGDGPNNAGPLVVGARDKVLRAGITINGLAIQINKGGYSAFSYFDINNLEKYYRDCVIGGQGAFALAIRKRSEFATAIRQKLLLEIAGRVPEPAPIPIQKAQFKPLQKPAHPLSDCEVGEKRWQQFWQDQE